MEKLLKYCLSLAVFFIYSCREEHKIKSFEERKKIASKIWTEENSKHGFNYDFQGTPKAMNLIESIIEIDSTNTDALRELSVPYLKRGMPLEWKPRFDRAVKHDPKTWQPWRGYLYLWFYRDYKKAIADFNASDTLTDYLDHPQGHSVDFWRGIAYLGLKDYDNSIFYWNKHIQRETNESGEDWVELEAFLYRGIAYYESGNEDKALENFDKVIHYFKKSADAKYYKAKILHEKSNHAEALEFVEEAISDFGEGYFNKRPYVETLRQIYRQDLRDLKQSILEGN